MTMLSGDADDLSRQEVVVSVTQLNSTQIQRKEAQGAYINLRSLKKK